MQIVNPTQGDTYDIYAAETGNQLFKAGTGTYDVYLVVVPSLAVGHTYDFANIVHRGTEQSAVSPPIHYTVTQAQTQRLRLQPKKSVDRKHKRK